MSIRTYEKYPYKTSFEAEVIECDQDHIILDNTIFFPEAGGQCADRGFIEGKKVTDVQEEGDMIIHEIKNHPFHVGDHVHGQIDWDFRFSNMQCHSGEHIFSGIVHKKFGYDNVGFHLGVHEMTVDFNGPISDEALKEIEVEVNKAIYQNKTITCFYPDRKTLETLDYRSKKEIKGDVRLVDIEGYDLCACCAPHVKSTGEIGMMKIISHMNYKGGIRVFLECGIRAFNSIRKDYENAQSLYGMLSANQESLVKHVKNLQDKNSRLESEIRKVQSDALSEKISHCEGESILLFEEQMETAIQREAVNKLKKKATRYAGVFVGNDQRGYRYILSSASLDMKELLDKLVSHGGKGGGSSEMIQGFISCKQEEIKTLID
ncbi:MAG: alanine--tRNA ligase-related protein [Kandleria vitulina]|uniref:alanyl-tRNA editing protein n=1 Tax=Kandleria vitulina TaxID=1630 RepID=UPI002E7A88C0|nr:alanine--tRNA ligase-related protein [Kandleria vitulina]MEE0988311.1 alanine--tRNA ligase-related protein [Kandleria vitulina]